MGLGAKPSTTLVLSTLMFNFNLVYIVVNIDVQYWGAWLELVDPDVTSTCHVQD